MLPKFIVGRLFLHLPKCSNRLQSSLSLPCILRQRDLLCNITNNNLESFVPEQGSIYAGFDPTADSLHIGNLIQLIALLHFKLNGYSTIALIGGATGCIGDPTGRTSARKLLQETTLVHNQNQIAQQLEHLFLNFEDYVKRRPRFNSNLTSLKPKILNNLEWFSKMSILDFLTEAGRHASVNTMLNRESVQARLSQSEGITFSELSYQLLQAYDFWELFNRENCKVQIGGSDQWGNIVSGIDLVRRKHFNSRDSSGQPPQLYGITLPLITTSQGEKLGKSAGNAVWLNNNLTSYYDFYQFFLQTPDDDVERFLKFFTLLSNYEISEIMKQHHDSPEDFLAQTTLASEVTELVHNIIGVKSAKIITRIMYNGGDDIAAWNTTDILQVFQGKSVKVSWETLKTGKADLSSLLFESGFVKSKKEAKRLIVGGGVNVNLRKVTHPGYALSRDIDFIDHRVCIIQVGKKQTFVAEVVP